MADKKVLLQVKDLKKYFPVGGKKLDLNRPHVKANDGITFDIYEGECLGLVGESGCGKSTLGRTLLRAYDVTDGSIVFNFSNKLADHIEKLNKPENVTDNGYDITNLNNRQMIPFRTEMQIIFQDPYSSLDPRMTVFNLISEALIEHKMFKANSIELEEYVKEIMEKCGLASYMMHKYPHQFSGGQRQRIGIARALALKPKFIVCDEAVSALDVSIQSQVLNLLMDLQKEMGFTYLFISHDLSVVKHISDRVGVMYLGNMVEIADYKELYANPSHPYTMALLSAIPTIDKDKAAKRVVIQGDIPSNVAPPSGCKFHTRCPLADELCAKEIPEFKEIKKGHKSACHHIDRLGDFYKLAKTVNKEEY